MDERSASISEYPSVNRDIYIVVRAFQEENVCLSEGYLQAFPVIACGTQKEVFVAG
jgi:hypothetical protein